MLRERNTCQIPDDLCDEVVKKIKTQPHQLVRTTFSNLTTCDHCGRILWGLIKQGLTCQTCGYVCHPSCIKEVVELKCTSKALDDASLNSLLTPTTKSPELNPKSSHGELLGLDEEHSGLIHKLINGEGRSVPVAKTATETATALGTSPTSPIPSANHLSGKLTKEKVYTSLRVNTKDHKKMMSSLRRHASVDFSSGDATGLTLPEPSPVTPSKLSLNNFVRDVMNTREKREKELERVRRNPSLNLMTTSMQNLTQFVPRITGVRIFRDNIVKIFTWENPKQTWTVFFIYVLVCLRPIWLVILPFIIMWFLVARDYLKTASETEGDRSKEKRSRPDKSKEPLPPAFSNFYPSAIGSDVAAAREMATKYTLNMQFMQNLMGTHVQVYEMNKKNWNDFKESYGPYWPVWVTVLGLPSSLLVYHLFSARTLFLLVGSYSLLGNNPYVMALAVNFSSLLVDELNSHLNLASLALKVRGITKSKFSTGPRTITISVFENQRWWAVLGWNDQTLSTERSSWTDETGKLDQTPIFQQQPEPGYLWEEDSNWQIVRDWCLPVQVDEGGWVYYNNLWSGPSAKSQLNSFTRRRLWTRKMVSE